MSHKKPYSFNIPFTKNNFDLPWHQDKYPKIDTVIIGHIIDIEGYIIKVSMLNYGGIIGYMSTSELSRKKIKSIRSIIKVGDIRPLLVIKVETKHDQIYIDLSNKQLLNFDIEIDRLEKYYKLIKIIQIWIKNINNIEYNQLEINNEYNLALWLKIMNLTIWQYPFTDIYDIFMDIKIKKKTFDESFPTFIATIKNTNSDLKYEDIDKLLLIIDKNINYDISIKISLKLTCWSLYSLNVIKTILNDIKIIPDTFYNSDLLYSSIISNSPNYDFIIKSTNKSLIDLIYQNDCSVCDTEIGKHIIQILDNYDDIDYDIEIERKDLY
jgi:translation initiation factor 2 alpha subunit (eIF-2alpha)